MSVFAIAIPAGILLPQSTLNETWFIVLSTVVAFNTIIYVGLTLSKLIPWPRQIHPAQVRSVLARIGFKNAPEAAVSQIAIPEKPESDDPYEALRRSVARRQIPQAFALLGGIVLLLSLASWLTFRERNLIEPVAELALGLTFLLIAQILSRRGIRGLTMRWVWIIASLVLVSLMFYEAYLNQSQVPLAYALVAMTMYSPITLAWRPTLVAAALMLIGMVVTSVKVPGIEDGRLVAVAVGALLAGFVLLQLRLSAIDELADERSRSHALASTDLLTGALSREGLLTLLPGLAATAERTDQSVCVMLFDVDDLTRANHQYGTHYGDDVLKAVYRAIDTTVRRGDLVSRWGGDEFVVAGLGNSPNAAAMGERIQNAVRREGVGLGKAPINVAVSTVAGLPSETTFDALLSQAENSAKALPGA